jgi:hypothetical protein
MEMIAPIFEHIAEGDFVVRIAKMVKDRVPQGLIHHVSEVAEIRGGADDGSAGSQYFLETFQTDVSRY